MSSVQGSGHRTKLPRRAAKAHDLHLELSRGLKRPQDPSALRRVRRANLPNPVYTWLLLPLPRRSQPRLPDVRPRGGTVPNHQAIRALPSARAHSSDTSSRPERPFRGGPTGLRPASDNTPEPLRRTRLTGPLPGYWFASPASVHVPRRRFRWPEPGATDQSIANLTPCHTHARTF